MNYEEINPFSAPEIRQSRSHGLKADVWSFGAIFYFLLFGNLKKIKHLGN